jgi:hypothetical protein
MEDGSKEIDLLDIIQQECDSKSNVPIPEVVETVVENTVAPNVGVDFSGFAGLGGLFDTGSNPGSGDVTQDLINWLNNSDRLPSDPLSSFLSNSSIKAEFALYYMLLSNISRIKTLAEFVKQSESILYNTDDLISMDEGELKERYANADKAMNNLIENSRRVVYQLKKKDDKEDVDKLKMLLGAIPTDKLKEIISSLR